MICEAKAFHWIPGTERTYGARTCSKCPKGSTLAVIKLKD